MFNAKQKMAMIGARVLRDIPMLVLSCYHPPPDPFQPHPGQSRRIDRIIVFGSPLPRHGLGGSPFCRIADTYLLLHSGVEFKKVKWQRVSLFIQVRHNAESNLGLVLTRNID